jgi:hypothetical protein
MVAQMGRGGNRALAPQTYGLGREKKGAAAMSSLRHVPAHGRAPLDKASPNRHPCLSQLHAAREV